MSDLIDLDAVRREYNDLTAQLLEEGFLPDFDTENEVTAGILSRTGGMKYEKARLLLQAKERDGQKKSHRVKMPDGHKATAYFRA